MTLGLTLTPNGWQIEMIIMMFGPTLLARALQGENWRGA